MRIHIGRKFSRKTIIRNFNSLVDKGEYEKGEKKKIIDFLLELSRYS